MTVRDMRCTHTHTHNYRGLVIAHMVHNVFDVDLLIFNLWIWSHRELPKDATAEDAFFPAPALLLLLRVPVMTKPEH